MKLQCTLFFLLLSSLVATLLGQEAVHYTTQEGLASNMVYEVLEDKQGYLWFSTEEGVCRFDGAAFECFTTADGMADNDIFGLYEDSLGKIWFLSYNGRLSYFWKDKIYNEQNDKILARLTLNSWLATMTEIDGTYYFASHLDGIKVWQANDSIVHFKTELYNRGARFVKMDTTIYLVKTRRRRYERDYCLTDIFQQKYYIEDPVKTALAINAPDIVALRQRRILLEQASLHKEALGFVFQHFSVDSRLADCSFVQKGNTFYLGFTGGGLWVIRKGNQGFTALEVLPNARIAFIFEDKEQNLWVNTLDDGIYFFPYSQLNFKPIAPSLEGVKGEVLLADDRLGIWLGTKEGVLQQLGTSTTGEIKVKQAVRIFDKNDNFRNLTSDGQKNIATLTEYKQVLLQPQTGKKRIFSYPVKTLSYVGEDLYLGVSKGFNLLNWEGPKWNFTFPTDRIYAIQ